MKFLSNPKFPESKTLHSMLTTVLWDIYSVSLLIKGRNGACARLSDFNPDHIIYPFSLLKVTSLPLNFRWCSPANFYICSIHWSCSWIPSAVHILTLFTSSSTSLWGRTQHCGGLEPAHYNLICHFIIVWTQANHLTSLPSGISTISEEIMWLLK